MLPHRSHFKKAVLFKRTRTNWLQWRLLPALLTVILMGCGGGGGSEATGASTPAAGDTQSVLSGVFLDSAVEGLYYETPTLSGMTDAQGTFSYVAGETIRFYIGDMLLGEGTAGAIMTPIDLVPGAHDETDQTVTNMSRMLLTIDQDGHPDNGIMITDQMSSAMTGMHISFDMPPDDFAVQPDMVALMSKMGMMDPEYDGRTLVPVSDAHAHMGQTMTDIAGMMGSGDSGGMGSGTGGMMGMMGADANE